MSRSIINLRHWTRRNLGRIIGDKTVWLLSSVGRKRKIVGCVLQTALCALEFHGFIVPFSFYLQTHYNVKCMPSSDLKYQKQALCRLLNAASAPITRSRATLDFTILDRRNVFNSWQYNTILYKVLTHIEFKCRYSLSIGLYPTTMGYIYFGEMGTTWHPSCKQEVCYLLMTIISKANNIRPYWRSQKLRRYNSRCTLYHIPEISLDLQEPHYIIKYERQNKCLIFV